MTTVPSYEVVASELNRFGKRRVKKVVDLTRRKGGPFTGDLCLALGVRETGLRNIAGDFGHGRGWLQIDDRYHGSWLAQVKGAISGSWRAVVRSALASGYVPLLVPALRRARLILQQNYDYVRSQGVPENQAVRVAISGYNAGPGGAINGWREGDSDKYTTGGDYADWVFEVRQHVRHYIHTYNL